MSIISSSFIASEGLSLCEIVLIIYLYTMLLCLILFRALPLTPDCYCSVIKLCPTLCNLMDCSTPGFSVPHHLPEFAQVHVHRIGDATQPSHPLTPSSPPALNLCSIRVFSNESAVHIRWLKYWSLGLPASALPKSIQG